MKMCSPPPGSLSVRRFAVELVPALHQMKTDVAPPLNILYGVPVGAHPLDQLLIKIVFAFLLLMMLLLMVDEL